MGPLLTVAWAVHAAAAAAPTVGVVRERGSGDPIVDAFVRYTQDGQEVQVGVDASGRFSLDLPDGSHTVLVGSTHHRPVQVQLVVPATAKVQVFLDPPEPPLEIVVEARRPSPHVSRQILDQERVERTPGTHQDPFRLLQALPGVAATREYGPQAGAMAIRGSLPAESRITVEGVEIPYLYHFQEYASVVHTRLLDELALYPSTFGPEYGDAIGGVAAVTLRGAGESRREGGRVHGAANVNLVMAGGLITVPAGQGGSVSVSGRRSYLDAVESSNDQYTLWPAFWDYAGRYDRELTPGRDLSLTLFGAGDHYGRYPGDTAQLDPLEVEGAAAFTYTRGFHAAILRHDATSERGRHKSTAAVVTDDHAGDLVTQAQQRTASWATLRQADVWRLHKSGDRTVDLSTGIDLQATQIMRQADPTQVWIELEAEAPLLAEGAVVHERLRRLEGGAWVEPRFTFGQVQLLPGVRLQADVTGGTALDGGPDTPTSTRVAVDPRMGSQWAAADDVRLRAAVGRYSQAPEPDALSAATGDPQLPVAHSNQAAVAADVAIAGRWEVGTELWGKTLNDVLVDELGEPPQAVDGWAAGVELSSRYRLRDRFFSWVSLTVGKAQRDDAPFDYDQPYALNAVASWALTERWTVGVRYRAAAGLPYTPVEDSVYLGDSDTYQAVLADTNSARMPGYQKVDLHIEHEIPFRTWTLSGYLAIWYVPPAANYLYPVWSFDYSQEKLVVGPPLLPLVGVEAEF